MKSKKLFTPFNLKGFKLKNRIGLAPMTRMSSSNSSIPRQDVFDFLVLRAKNEVSIIYTEAIVTDYESAQGYPGQARILNQAQIDAWKPVVKEIQKEGAIAIMQIFHCGRIAWPEVNPANRIIAPSPITVKDKNAMTGLPYPVPKAMSQFDIDHVITGFVETAKGAIEAGFDGVEIHGAHGYLISQFLSPYSNQRTDIYGNSIENRYRFAHEVIHAVKKVIPDDRLLTFRISDWGVADMKISLLGSKEEYQNIIKYLSNEPIDAISVSTYAYDKKAFGTDKNMAQLTREATELPIMICGSIYDHESAEKALEDADIILSAKSLLLNPNWVEDVRENKTLKPYKSEEAAIAYTKEPLP